MVTGRLDGRFTTYTLDRPEETPDWDATDAAMDGAFVAAGNQYLRETLKYNPPLLYRHEIYDLIYADGNSWDNKHNGLDITNVAPDLAQTMTYNPAMKSFLGERLLRFRNAVLRDAVRVEPSVSRAADSEEHHLRFLRIGTHGLSPRSGPGAVPRRSGALVRSSAAESLTGEKSHVLKRLVLSTLTAAFAFAGMGLTASAAAPAGPPPAAAPAPPVDEAPDAVTQQTITLDGKVYPYTARAGTITLTNAKGDPTCRMFYTAFTLDGVDTSTRPVTFFYNGGPGSSTIWLRMGSFGPKRVVVPDGGQTPNAPFNLVDNQYTLLDRSDLVFVDAPGTGFSRLTPAGKPDQFYGVDQDQRAFAQFINRYVSNFNRWNSPKVSLRRIVPAARRARRCWSTRCRTTASASAMASTSCSRRC